MNHLYGNFQKRKFHQLHCNTMNAGIFSGRETSENRYTRNANIIFFYIDSNKTLNIGYYSK